MSTEAKYKAALILIASGKVDAAQTAKQALEHSVHERLPNLVGMKYGRLTVLAKEEPRRDPNGKTVGFWTCQCECGNKKSLATRDLRSGNTQSCGCLSSEMKRFRMKKRWHHRGNSFEDERVL